MEEGSGNGGGHSLCDGCDLESQCGRVAPQVGTRAFVADDSCGSEGEEDGGGEGVGDAAGGSDKWTRGEGEGGGRACKGAALERDRRWGGG